MNKQLPPFFIITGSCVRSQTFTPKYTSTETWVRYSDFVDYFPVALDECAEDKVALAEENARLKAEVQRDTEIHRRNTAMWKDDCEYHHAENARLKAEIERLDNLVRYWSEKYQNENARFLRASERIAAKEGKQS